VLDLLGVVVGAVGGLLGCMTPPPVYPSSEICRGEERPPGPPLSLIDDAEEGSGQVIGQDGRSGFFYSYIDPHSVLTLGPTMSRQLPRPVAGGANGSRCAWNLRGELARQRIAFVGLGVNMTNPKGAYDASRFTGISFFARRSPGSATFVRVQIPDWNTDPAGHVCKDCFNTFGRRIALSDEWRKYTLPFDTFEQLPGWGSPRPPRVDASNMFGIQFQITEPGARFDVWIDDIAFVESEAPVPPAQSPGPGPAQQP
jgi:hypothetical protein